MRRVIDIGRKVAVGKITIAIAEAGKIETQHCDTACCQGARDAGCGGDILTAGKTVREQSETRDSSIVFRQFQQSCQGLIIRVVEFKLYL